MLRYFKTSHWLWKTFCCSRKQIGDSESEKERQRRREQERAGCGALMVIFFTWLIIQWSHSSQRPTIDPALFKEIKRHWSRVTWKHLKRMREIPLRMSNGTFLAIDLCTHSQDDITSLSLTHAKKFNRIATNPLKRWFT